MYVHAYVHTYICIIITYILTYIHTYHHILYSLYLLFIILVYFTLHRLYITSFGLVSAHNKTIFVSYSTV